MKSIDLQRIIYLHATKAKRCCLYIYAIINVCDCFEVSLTKLPAMLDRPMQCD